MYLYVLCVATIWQNQNQLSQHGHLHQAKRLLFLDLCVLCQHCVENLYMIYTVFKYIDVNNAVATICH